jgi:putative two-component system response regulator
MLERLAVTADLREDASGEHGYRVGRLAALLAEELRWKPQACEALDLAARLHDIGKVGVPDRILLESAALKEAERKVMSSHTVIGSELLSKSNVAEIRMAEEIARCHHEWWDGTGYPAGLKAKRIPAGARITALADVFDAMTHGRPYAQAWPIEVALDKIAELGGTQFDPDMTERFIPLVRRLRDEHEDLDAYLGRAAKSSPFLQARSRIRQMLSQGRLEDGTGAPDPSSTLH